MSKGTLMTNGLPQVSVPRTVMFNAFVHDIDSEIKCTVRRFADDMKLCGAADMPEGQDVIHSDLDKLEKWAHGTLMRFKKAK
ncbi:rna-directed dna polymerase from mobile element jockey-like [Willisornis vidua]|uniref:Rna-directed dna polymerase from mobile element jockey-like n=1 Tax=Willisornis vidua TaxID=1566151 RepID=A0ABQ9CRA8_9PASS|nr:rna-directed dna polymerase from mobile element jockey-like [Willisornis vidua]